MAKAKHKTTTAKKAAPRNPFDELTIGTAGFDDIKAALSAGISDFFKRPFLSMFFGLVYVLFGLALLAGILIYGNIWMIVAAGVGFPLIAPFLAAGLYEMSRRYEKGETISAGAVFSVIFRQQRREFGWMAFVVLFVFWVWVYQARNLMAIILQWHSFATISDFANVVFFTTDGMLFLAIGSVVGAIIASVLYSITVIAMPLLLDREIDFISAMILSVKAVAKSPFVMLFWGAAIAALVFISMLPAFLGLIVTLPVLGHTSWHLYRRLVREK